MKAETQKTRYEIERKWLLADLPGELKAYPHTELSQGYLCTEPVVRVRRDGERYELTYKGAGLLVREEYNLPLTKEAFAHLMKKADGHVIEKTRYRIPLETDGLIAELDVFHGAFAGLMFVEVEFQSPEAAAAFEPPLWFGAEVTKDRRYSNSSLSRNGIPGQEGA